MSLPQVSEFEKVNSSKYSQIDEEEVKIAPVLSDDAQVSSKQAKMFDTVYDDNKIRQIVKEEIKVLGSEIV